MNCAQIEERLSEYIESSLPAEEMAEIAYHLRSCGSCADLTNEMRALVTACRSYPSLELDARLLETILLRTSGRPLTRSFREQLYQYLVQPLMTPRYAVGAGLAILFMALMINLGLPRLSTTVSSVSAVNLFGMVDRGMQRIYSKGLRAYDIKNEWIDQFTFFKNNTINKMRFMMERIDVPIEGRKKTIEPAPDKEPSSNEKTSRVLSWSACLDKGSSPARPRFQGRS